MNGRRNEDGLRKERRGHLRSHGSRTDMKRHLKEELGAVLTQHAWEAGMGGAWEAEQLTVHVSLLQLPQDQTVLRVEDPRLRPHRLTLQHPSDGLWVLQPDRGGVRRGGERRLPPPPLDHLLAAHRVHIHGLQEEQEDGCGRQLLLLPSPL